jgi:hypothetical protein
MDRPSKHSHGGKRRDLSISEGCGERVAEFIGAHKLASTSLSAS